MSHINESWHIWMSHGTHKWIMAHMNESWHKYMSHGKYEWVMAHMNESWHIWVNHGTYEGVRALMNSDGSTLQHTATIAECCRQQLPSVAGNCFFAKKTRQLLKKSNCWKNNCLQHSAIVFFGEIWSWIGIGAKRCNHTAPHCTTLQHTETHCNTQKHTATTHLSEIWLRNGAGAADFAVAKNTATHCNNTLQQHTATTHCNNTP